MLIKTPVLETNENNTLNPQMWVSKYADYLYTYAVLRINDEELARDLVQETFLAALERKDKFKERSSEKTWLTSILKNKIIDVYRSRPAGLTKKVNGPASADINDDCFDHNNGHWKNQHNPVELGIEQPDALENKEFRKILKACMKKLPALWYAVFSMKHLNDESTEVICSELRLTSSNFWVIIHRTKVNLRSCLQKNWS